MKAKKRMWVEDKGFSTLRDTSEEDAGPGNGRDFSILGWGHRRQNPKYEKKWLDFCPWQTVPEKS